MATGRLRLEHRRDKILPLPHFLRRQGRYTLFAFSLIALSVGAGTIGYRFLASLSWIDSFYMASMILTGMGPVAEMTTSKAKLFSSFYALYSGISFLSMMAVFFAPIVHRLLHILHAENSNN